MSSAGLTRLKEFTASAKGQPTVLVIFAATLFLSAILLFSVQPMFAKMVLPQLGGAPSVWAVSTCFFQAVLLAGYCYAHLLNTWVSPARAPLVHLALMAAAFLMLPIALPSGGGEPPADGAYLWLMGTLALGVGLPFFAVSANAPLLQAWFSRTGNPHARDPYFLYGASNFGSLIALLAYPVVIEPLIGLQFQSQLWTAGFALLAAAILACGFVMTSLGRTNAAVGATAVHSETDLARQPSNLHRLRWIFLALVPSGLLVAVTTYVSTDIAAAPFLWVIPLALFLLTFVLVFTERPWVSQRVMLALQPAIVTLTIAGLVLGAFPWTVSSLLALSSFVITTLVAHRTLYEERPPAAWLTEFYLWMSVGGALGGLFAAVIAPQVFNSIYEFPLLLAAGMLCRPGIFAALKPGEARSLGYAAATIALLMTAGLIVMAVVSEMAGWMFSLYAILAGTAALILTRAEPRGQAMAVAAMALAVVLLPSSVNRGNPERSFFGVLRVMESEDGTMRRFHHGTTSHGAQRLKDEAGKAISPPTPATYYYPGSPMAKALQTARDAAAAHNRPFRSGIIGLGIGSMACYAQPGDSWRFFEIDSAVVAIASDAQRFTFLSTCLQKPDVVLGDARLTIGREPEASFEYLQVDAFSSDAVPTHLLTAEAVQTYLTKLSADGVLVLHVSNRHLDLAPVASAAALAIPGALVAVVRGRPAIPSLDQSPSTVVVVTRSSEIFDSVKTWPNTEIQTNPKVAAWTDDYSNIVSAMWRVYGPKR